MLKRLRFRLVDQPPLTWGTWVRFLLWLWLGLAVYVGFSYRHSELNDLES
jgi:APA family basic amino acid/polyamine antiporter